MSKLLLIQIMVYSFSTIIAQFPISFVVGRMWASVGVKPSNASILRPHAWTSKMVGLVERGLYIFALQIGTPEFIGIWLAIKVAGSWQRWTDGLQLDKKNN
jgi:hypothetical protein